MPKRKTRQEASLAAETSCVRTQLAILRGDLLKSMQELHVDRIPLGDRVIVCKELCSARRITQKLLLGVVQHTLEGHNGARVPDAITLFVALKTQLLEVVDKKSHSCDVLLAHSHEAQRQPRDGRNPIVGDADLLSEEMIANANEIWQLKTQSSHIAQKRKALKTLKTETQPIALPECDTMPVSPSSGETFTAASEEASPQQLSASPAVGESSPWTPAAVFDEAAFACTEVDDGAAPLPIEAEMITTALPTPVKPKSSVSKKLAYVLVERIADHLFSLCRSNRIPYWEKVEGDVTSMVNQFYIDPTAES